MEVACGLPSGEAAWAGSELSELSALLQASRGFPTFARTPTLTYLGVSPPVRSGAANPWAHDAAWARAAYSASHTNLQALRELDSTGESFLRAGAGSSCSAGGAALVLVSPDAALGPLGDAVAHGDGGDGGACDDAERLSDAGSESTAAATPSPAAAAGAGGLSWPLAAPARRAAAPLAMRGSLPACCGAPPLPPAVPAPARVAAPAMASALRPLRCGAAAAAAAAAPAPAAAPPAAACAKQQPALEPFACRTSYYV
ncbi:MAG: hypothetical protein J3K34DRAFT_520274 [Monoraphidium minutum]|nr:MAG: hypothetical protein J3K34DRAFT_520274 [Monoraphidium minutum]